MKIRVGTPYDNELRHRENESWRRKIRYESTYMHDPGRCVSTGLSRLFYLG